MLSVLSISLFMSAMPLVKNPPAAAIAVEQTFARVHAFNHDRLVEFALLRFPENPPLVVFLGPLLVDDGNPHKHRQQHHDCEIPPKSQKNFSGNIFAAD